jgi:rsbT antagonist protein RsbS
LGSTESSVVLQAVGEIVVVPLRDPVHDAFFEELSSKILSYLSSNSAKGVILDMSGVEILDQQDFEQMHHVCQCAALMGAPIVLAGVRPGVAAGLTMLDVDASWVQAKRNVDLAMECLE